MSITLRQLEIFYTVAKIGHVTNSSEILGISQSAISMALQELEKSLETKLFERIGRALVLNENGRELYDRAFKVLQDVKAIEDDFLNKEVSGHLIIGASQTVANYILPSIVYRFNKAYPMARLELRISNTEEIAHMITTGSVDIGFVEGSVSDPMIDREYWCDDHLAIVTHKATVLEQRPYDIKELAEKKWIMRERGSGTRKFFEESVIANKFKLGNTLEIGGFGAIKEIIKEESNTFAVISTIAVTDEIKNGTLKTVPLKNCDMVREFSIINYKNKFKSKLYNQFVEFAKTHNQLCNPS